MSKIFEYIKKYDILVFIILGLVLYFPTVFYDFVSDDLTMLLPNPYLNGKFLINFVDFFIPNLICKDIYTPLSFILANYKDIWNKFLCSSFC